MAADYLSTRALDHELGFNWSAIPKNTAPMTYEDTLDPYYRDRTTNAQNQQGMAIQNESNRAQRANYAPPQPYSYAGGSGYDSPSFANYLNPKVISNIYAAQRPPGPGRQPSAPNRNVARPDTADYSTAGQMQRDQPQTDLQRFGGTWQGGRWVANRAPNGYEDYLRR